ncbi:MAG TPA: FAD-dependent oxidoreductase, partial [Gammaproteobacteria bacterium]|nr:FAD-dependent oxidoreductase [Gammaproteobacteria bacterium]
MKTGSDGRLKIAIIGAGISGLTAAYRLHRDFEIDVYEASHYAGGHTNTAEVRVNGQTHAIDTGFIVCNDRTYPNFLALLHELGVAYEKSDMGFSVRVERTGLEYCGSSMSALFAQRRNLLNPRFYRMLTDILRFNRVATASLQDQTGNITLGEFLKAQRFSDMFVHYYIIPMGAAIWSALPEKMFEFPASTFIRFFHNHGLLSVNNRPAWYFIKGGSRSYVEKLTAGFRERIHLNSAVTQIRRGAGKIEVTLQDGTRRSYDHAVIAVHSDQALAMLADPAEAERSVLGAIPYQENVAVLHTDERMLPRRRLARAAWNYHV